MVMQSIQKMANSLSFNILITYYMFLRSNPWR